MYVPKVVATATARLVPEAAATTSVGGATVVLSLRVAVPRKPRKALAKSMLLSWWVGGVREADFWLSLVEDPKQCKPFSECN